MKFLRSVIRRPGPGDRVNLVILIAGLQSIVAQRAAIPAQ